MSRALFLFAPYLKVDSFSSSILEENIFIYNLIKSYFPLRSGKCKLREEHVFFQVRNDVWRNVAKDKGNWMVDLFYLGLVAVDHHYFCLHLFKFQCDCLCFDLLERAMFELSWKLLFIDSCGSLQGNEEETQDDTFNSIRFIDNLDDTDRCVNRHQNIGFVVLGDSGHSLLLVYY